MFLALKIKIYFCRKGTIVYSFLILSKRVKRRMDIEYRKGTLYVYIKTEIDEQLLDRLEKRVYSIVERYNIDNLVIDTEESDNELLALFCKRYNKRYRKKILVR